MKLTQDNKHIIKVLIARAVIARKHSLAPGSKTFQQWSLGRYQAFIIAAKYVAQASPIVSI